MTWVIADGRGPVALAGGDGRRGVRVTSATPPCSSRERLLRARRACAVTCRRLALPVRRAALPRFERPGRPGDGARGPRCRGGADRAHRAGGRVGAGHRVRPLRDERRWRPPTIRSRPRRVVALLGTRLAAGRDSRAACARLGATAARSATAHLSTAVRRFGGIFPSRGGPDRGKSRALGGYDRVPVALHEVPLARRRGHAGTAARGPACGGPLVAAGASPRW